LLYHRLTVADLWLRKVRKRKVMENYTPEALQRRLREYRFTAALCGVLGPYYGFQALYGSQRLLDIVFAATGLLLGMGALIQALRTARALKRPG
jgi:hypothetical protein